MLVRLREDEHHHSPIEKANPDPAILAIILAFVPLNEQWPIEDAASVGKVQGVLAYVGLVLLLIPDEVHNGSVAAALSGQTGPHGLATVRRG